MLNRSTIAILLVMGLIAVLASAQDKPPSTAAGPAASQPAIPEDFTVMARLFELKGERLDLFMQKVQTWKKAWGDYSQSENGRKFEQLQTQIAASQKDGDQARAEQLEKEVQPLRRERQELRYKLRADIFSMFTVDEHRRYAGFRLSRYLMRGLTDARLTEAQAAKSREICVEVVTPLITEGTLAKDPGMMFLRDARTAARQRIVESVLTDEQRARLVPPTTQPRRPATQPSDRF